jgi:hypothetical protein
VQKRATLLAGRGPFDEAVDEIEKSTGAHLPKRQLELIVAEAAEDFESFYEQRSQNPDKENKNDTLLVASLDCKGVPRRKTTEELAENQPLRINPGEKRTKKKMATVATVHTCQPYYRTAEHIVEKLIDGTTKKISKYEGTNKSPPRFKNRRLWASLKKSKDEVFTEVVQEMEKRDDHHKKHAICVMDGERALHRRAVKILAKKFPKIIIILDIIHVLDYLWEAGFAFHPDGREEAQKWVRERFLAILEGQVSLVVSGIRQSATKRELDGKLREAVDRTCNYFLNNKNRMRYDEYLKKGFPIASGSAEGACCHLVKDRMELTGAIWDVEESRAEAVLKIRALDKSGDFEEYWDFHMKQEYLRQYNDDWKAAA